LEARTSPLPNRNASSSLCGTDIVYGYGAQQAADVFPCNRQFLPLKHFGQMLALYEQLNG